MKNGRDYWFMKGNQQKGEFSVYVDNLPESLHWQGLWHIFARHGDVVDAYITNKLNKRGRRFSFVRFEKEVDSARALERLNGILVFGNKIFVGIAKYNVKTSDRSGMKQENSNGKVHENSRDKYVQVNNNGNAHENSSDKNIPT
ncbi:hypothetical protein V6N13_063754 [Hibiscus sabdariffa]